MFSPGVLTVLRPALARAPTPACTNRAVGSIATYPTILASFPLPQVNGSETTLVAPPGPALQTKLTAVPVRPTPAGLTRVRSPAVSPLTFESTPERGVTGWPLSTRYDPFHCQPCASARSNPFEVETFG